MAKTTANAALGRMEKPEEIGGIAVFLAAKTDSFATGQTLVVDGGTCFRYSSAEQQEK